MQLLKQSKQSWHTLPETLVLYDQDAPTKITPDASAYSLETGLLQQHDTVSSL